MKYYIIYQIVNNVNNMLYVGKHMTNNLEDNYMGSGTQIRDAILKYGIENFEKKILHILETEEEMILKEKEIVNETFVLRKDTYNLAIGGDGGRIYRDGKMVNGFCDKKIAIKGRLKTNKIIHDRIQNDLTFRNNFCEQVSKGLKKFIANGGKLGGTPHKLETKIKIGIANSIQQKGEKNSQFGTHWITNGEENKKIKKDDLQFWINQNWKLGRKIK